MEGGRCCPSCPQVSEPDPEVERMKGVLAVFIAIAVVAGEESEEHDLLIEEGFADACKERYPFINGMRDSAEMESTEREIAEGFHNKKCLLTCVFEEAGLMKEGKFMKDTAIYFIDFWLSGIIGDVTKIMKAVERCGKVPVDETDPCEKVPKMIRCWSHEVN